MCWVILLWEAALPAHWKIFNSIPHLCLPDSSSNSSHPIHKNISRPCQIFPGGKITPTGELCSTARTQSDERVTYQTRVLKQSSEKGHVTQSGADIFSGRIGLVGYSHVTNLTLATCMGHLLRKLAQLQVLEERHQQG